MIDLSKSYFVPMSKEDASENEEEYVKCTVKQVTDHLVISAIQPGYREKRFYPEYFDFLIRIHYNIIVDRKGDSYYDTSTCYLCTGHN